MEGQNDKKKPTIWTKLCTSWNAYSTNQKSERHRIEYGNIIGNKGMTLKIQKKQPTELQHIFCLFRRHTFLVEHKGYAYFVLFVIRTIKPIISIIRQCRDGFNGCKRYDKRRRTTNEKKIPTYFNIIYLKMRCMIRECVCHCHSQFGEMMSAHAHKFDW